jgi:hypothetical protein
VAELEQVLGGQQPRYEHLEQLPYLQVCEGEGGGRHGQALCRPASRCCGHWWGATLLQACVKKVLVSLLLCHPPACLCQGALNTVSHSCRPASRCLYHC